MLAVLERLSKARAHRHEHRDSRRRRGVVVGAEVAVEEGLGQGEQVLLTRHIGIRCDDSRIGPAEDEGAVRDLHNMEEVEVHKHSVR